jgi:hypothetical protein
VLALSATRQGPVALLEAQARTRLPDLVPVRYARMLTSPFAAVMVQDLAPTATTGLTVQACGDMHVANFGLFASAERRLIFGINDFDPRFRTTHVSLSNFWVPLQSLCQGGDYATLVPP